MKENEGFTFKTSLTRNLKLNNQNNYYIYFISHFLYVIVLIGIKSK